MRFFWIVAAPLLTGCPPPAPAPTPSPPVDAGILTPCGAACSSLAAACGPQLATCETTLQAIDDNRLLRESSGKPFACEDAVDIITADGMRSLGLPCP